MKLTEILKTETDSLRIQFIERKVEFAREKFEVATNNLKTNMVAYFDMFGVKYEMKPNSAGKILPITVGGGTNTKAYAKALSQQSMDWRMVDGGLEKFLDKTRNLAERHYQESIDKLAVRIESKGLDIQNLSVKTAHIGVNIETTLTDGNKTVRAFTIIASGPIQGPHYRYLVR